jgi:hypothetical protein
MGQELPRLFWLFALWRWERQFDEIEFDSTIFFGTKQNQQPARNAVRLGIRLSSATYGTDDSLATDTNALDGVTFYARGTNASGQSVLTSTAPDSGAHIETHYQDGSLLSVTGSAAHPMQYLYGVDGDGPFTTETNVTETGGTNEWVKTSTDLLGRAYRTTYATTI